MTRPRVLVAGTGFGRAYLAAFERADFDFELAGILASGSARSRACAEHYGVPLWSTVDEVPDDVDLACVVVGGVMNGGPGPALSQALMRRGVHVLQEHPLHPDELVACLRAATEAGVVFRLNTHYPHVEPVRRFIGVARDLVARQRPLFLDVTCAFQVLYTVFDILGQALGAIRPHGVDAALATADEAPYRSLTGRFAGVPMSFRLQNELVPSDPDNYSHLFHRVTLGTDGGHLTLVNTHGPVEWSMRPHMPGDMKELVRLGDSAAPHLKVPSVQHLGPAEGASYTEVLRELWPRATARAIGATWDDVRAGADSRGHVQYHVALARLAMRVTEACGPVRLHHPKAPELLSAADLSEVGA
ncbi:Gfo/Idh/MocA family oxidoreductase [Streptomyces alkaliterrae]|uniref:Gfo/Idh/MocA family oxidoreductase n=1 Tax=Streptomyces alkaliterrae TaxID=2213162 RepID=A0A5P0YST2_9ACTN|nr:Gfo/Idh/MocA family oxidoreductase [Streptomyces alkaliterrae]MBB1252645.1 Gfo/Idh/MocA family oxidoreductase [Streptomyces alkaliterrae]MBB1257457.1 Gfo/Idh/MocA family oxidoreductase [Streptomyces alkaliterrae]MQS02960.1 thiazolinyl imide reductase [Streptomyces alkaliterrae]